MPLMDSLLLYMPNNLFDDCIIPECKLQDMLYYTMELTTSLVYRGVIILSAKIIVRLAVLVKSLPSPTPCIKGFLQGFPLLCKSFFCYGNGKIIGKRLPNKGVEKGGHGQNRNHCR